MVMRFPILHVGWLRACSGVTEARDSRGVVRNGVVIFGETTVLPEGTEVRVEPIVQRENVPSAGPTLAEQFRDVIGTVPDLPSDMAEQHDHYLHGAPKR